MFNICRHPPARRRDDGWLSAHTEQSYRNQLPLASSGPDLTSSSGLPVNTEIKGNRLAQVFFCQCVVSGCGAQHGFACMMSTHRCARALTHTHTHTHTHTQLLSKLSMHLGLVFSNTPSKEDDIHYRVFGSESS